MTDYPIPDHYQRIYSQATIAQRVSELGRELQTWVQQSHDQDGEQVLAICILRGGVFFFSDLLKAIPYTVEPSFCRTMSYCSKENVQSDSFRLVVEPAEIRNRRILLVDDICDSGQTLRNLHDYALEKGAKEVRTACLIHRIHDASVYKPYYTGFEYVGTEWFAGYGMEDKNHRSNVPEVFIIEPS